MKRSAVKILITAILAFMLIGCSANSKGKDVTTVPESKIYEEATINEKIKDVETKFRTKQNFDIIKLKDIVEISFYDEKRKCLIKDKEYIEKFSDGIIKAKFWGQQGADFIIIWI